MSSATMRIGSHSMLMEAMVHQAARGWGLDLKSAGGTMRLVTMGKRRRRMG
jgi:hypothetical protein